jgi:hypothetical protein
MPETATWAKLGTTTWRVDIILDDGDDPFAETVASAEFPARSLGLAKAYAARQLSGRVNPPARYDGGNNGMWWAQIRRGTFVDDSFDTADDGRVRDASWEPDTDRQDTAIAYMVYLRDNGTLEWADPDFEGDDAGTPTTCRRPT